MLTTVMRCYLQTNGNASYKIHAKWMLQHQLTLPRLKKQ